MHTCTNHENEAKRGLFVSPEIYTVPFTSPHSIVLSDCFNIWATVVVEKVEDLGYCLNDSKLHKFYKF